MKELPPGTTAALDAFGVACVQQGHVYGAASTLPGHVGPTFRHPASTAREHLIEHIIELVNRGWRPGADTEASTPEAPLTELVARIPEPPTYPVVVVASTEFNAEAQQNPPQHVLMPDGDLRYYATRGDPEVSWGMGDLLPRQRALVRERKCPFNESWVGFCCQAAEEHSLFCKKHNEVYKARCFACGARSTRNCEHTSALVCGVPECPKHKHMNVHKF